MNPILLNRILKDVERIGAKDYNLELIDFDFQNIVTGFDNIIDIVNSIVYVFETKAITGNTISLESFENIAKFGDIKNNTVVKFLSPILLNNSNIAKIEVLKYVKVNLIR